MDYATLKLIHVCMVVLSGGGFIARGLGAWRAAAWIRYRAARTLPHLVDTVLLLSALGMLWVAHLPAWALPWLRAKIIGLAAYIVLGIIALRGLRAASPAAAAVATTPGLRGSREAQGAPAAASGRALPLAAWVAALLVFAYIVSVALTKNPWGALSLLRS